MAPHTGHLLMLHGLFYAVFVPRGFQRWVRPLWPGTARPAGKRSPAAPVDAAASAEPNAAPRAGTDAAPAAIDAAAPIAINAAAPASADAAQPVTACIASPAWIDSSARTFAPDDGDVRSTDLAPLALHAVAMGLLYASILRLASEERERRRRRATPPARPAAATATAGAGAGAAVRRAAGGAMVVAAAGLAGWTLAVFRSWRLLPRIAEQHELCTAGPFRRVRHPIYLAMDLLAWGSWLWHPTAPAATSAALVTVAGDLRGRAEERRLEAAFGAAYQDYRRRVRRFLPGLY